MLLKATRKARDAQAVSAKFDWSPQRNSFTALNLLFLRHSREIRIDLSFRRRSKF